LLFQEFIQLRFKQLKLNIVFVPSAQRNWYWNINPISRSPSLSSFK